MNATATVNNLTNMNATDLQALLHDLQAKAESLETPDADMGKIHKEIAEIYGAIRTQKKSRGTELDALKLKQESFQFSIKELFGDDALSKFTDLEITHAAQERGLFTAKARNVSTGEEKTKRTTVARVFTSDTNDVFIDIPRKTDDHQKVADVVIKQGRTNEFYQGKQIFTTISKPLMRLKGKDVAETEKNIAKFVVQEATDYAKTPEGKAELKKLAEFTFHYVDPKVAKAKVPAEPHNEAQAAMQETATA